MCKNVRGKRQTMRRFWRKQSKWSQATFGSDFDRGPLGPLKHLRKEAQEAINSATVQEEGLRMEIVDCLFLVVDAARRSGMTYDDLLKLAFEKLEINKSRKWNVLSTPDEPSEHVRS